MSDEHTTVAGDYDLLLYQSEIELVRDRLPGNYIPTSEQSEEIAAAIIHGIDRRRALMANPPVSVERTAIVDSEPIGIAVSVEGETKLFSVGWVDEDDEYREHVHADWKGKVTFTQAGVDVVASVLGASFDGDELLTTEQLARKVLAALWPGAEIEE